MRKMGRARDKKVKDIAAKATDPGEVCFINVIW
jgi:hypothetical protein